MRIEFSEERGEASVKWAAGNIVQFDLNDKRVFIAKKDLRNLHELLGEFISAYQSEFDRFPDILVSEVMDCGESIFDDPANFTEPTDGGSSGGNGGIK